MTRIKTNHRPPEGFERWQVTLNWHGAGFVGWQSQTAARSIQDTLWRALEPLLAAPNDSFRPVAAGRTDAGVHAEAMTAHLDIRRGSFKPAAAQLARALNAHLPPDLAVTDIKLAAPFFHARFTCTERQYIYRVLNTPQRHPLWEGRALHYPAELDLAAIRRAAALLVGQHDFAAFATQEERQTVRKLCRLEASQRGELIEFEVAGESFLRHMVRGLVGTLLRVGASHLSAEQVQAVLASGSRSRAGANAPAHGLYFSGAVYGRADQTPSS